MLTTLRKWAAALILLGGCGFIGVGIYLNCHAVKGCDSRALVFLGTCLAGAVLALVGVVTNRTWGRWLAMASGVSVLSAVGTVAGSQGRVHVVGLIAAGCAAALVLLLSGRTMAERLGARGNPFVTSGGRARLLGLSVVLSLAAIPMLWGWGWLGHYGQHTGRLLALVAGGLLGLGALLIIWQRTAGLLALLLGGSLALGLAIWLFTGGLGAYPPWELGAQWLLAAGAAVVAIFATARPVCRLLMGKPPVA